MELKDQVRNELQERGGVYYLRNQRSFNYSDGSAVERYIREVIEAASDVSSSSLELEGHIRDWPTLYHFSRQRPFAFNSLNLPPSAAVFEVGSGCGAITRFLGERVAQVLALEGSSYRAAITRARTRDLTTVSVLCASFEDAVINAKFDYIVCNGVLEYAPLFVHHAEPAREFIRRLVALLKPTGSLLLAIENKLGLRYFCSGKEEHTSIMFDGVEGYPRFPKGPKTFGHSELYTMLREHCSSVETFLPLPDYKLPKALIRAELLSEVNCADLFATMERRDFGTAISPLMHQRLVWHELQKNNLMKEFANSFLMVAGEQPLTSVNSSWLGDIYSVDRHAELMARTTISRREDGVVEIAKSRLSSTEPATTSPVGHSLERSAWIDGTSVHTLIAQAFLRSDGASLDDRLRVPILAWWDGVVRSASKGGILEGFAIDCTWQNAIMKDGRVYFIDLEWSHSGPVDPVLVIYRAVANFLAHELCYLRRWNRSCQILTEVALLRAVASVLGIDASANSIRDALRVDLRFLESVHGSRSSVVKRYLRLYTPFYMLHLKSSLARVISTVTRRGLGIFQRFGARFRRVDANDRHPSCHLQRQKASR